VRATTRWTGLLVAVVLGAATPALAGAQVGRDAYEPDYDAIAGVSPLTFESGPALEALTKTRRWAWPLLMLSFIAALVLELVMAEEARYGLVVRRLVFAIVLLLFYNSVFGTVVNGLGDIAGWLAPQGGVITKYKADVAKARVDAREKAAAQQQASGAAAEPGMLGRITTNMADALYDTGIELVILLCTAILFIIMLTGKFLVGMLYILGPIAVALGVPRASGVAGKWFKELVTFASWPIFIAVFLALLQAVGANGMAAAGSVLGSVVTAGIMAVAAIFVPSVASALVGGGIGNVAHRAGEVVEALGTKGMGATARATAGQAQALGGAASTQAASQATRVVEGTGAALGKVARVLSGGGGSSAASGGGASSSPPAGGGAASASPPTSP